jgi:hypothetical protein
MTDQQLRQSIADYESRIQICTRHYLAQKKTGGVDARILARQIKTFQSLKARFKTKLAKSIAAKQTQLEF